MSWTAFRTANPLLQEMHDYNSRARARSRVEIEMCEHCEGVGTVPVQQNDRAYRGLWEAAEAEEPSEDGWHFVCCAHCAGSGTVGSLRNIIGELRGALS